MENLPAVVRHHMALLVVAQALSTAVFQTMPALGGVMVLHLTGNVALTGLALAISGLGQVLTAYPGGRMMDRYGRRAVFAVSAACSSVAAALIAWTFGLGLVVTCGAAILLFGAAAGPLRSLSMAAADMSPPERRGRAVGLLLMGSVAGALLTPLVVATLTRRPGLPEATGITMTWAAGAMFFALAVPALLLLRPDPLEIARVLHAEPAGTAPGPAAVMETPGLQAVALRTALVTSAFVQGNMSMAMALTPVALRAHGHHLSDIVLAVSIHTIGMFAFGVPFGALADRWGRRPVMLAALATSAVSTFGSVASTDYWVSTIFLFLVGVGWSAGVVAATALLSDHTAPDERGRYFGLNELGIRVAMLAFPVLGGMLVGAWGFAAAGAVIGVAILTPLLLVLRLPPRPVTVAAGD